MVNKYHFVKGGSERYVFDLKGLLEKNRHQVIPFAMADENNLPSIYSRYFVDHVDYGARARWKSLGHAARLIYSFHARRKIEALIEATKPDVAHLHMIDHQISPSILHSLRKYRIPAVQTVHQYKLICPNYRLYIESKNKICERCLAHKFYQPLLTRCQKNSVAASALIALEAYVHHWLRTYVKNIELFHAPSAFMKKMLTKGGIDEQKIEFHFLLTQLDELPFSPIYDNYFLFIGRLSPEKGVMTLLKAMTQVKRSKLLLVGEGPQRAALERFIRKKNIWNVEFLGYKNRRDLREIMSRTSFTVFPSEWYENSPLAVYEAFSMGKPVIGSAIGSTAEFIEPNANGLQFVPGDDQELAACINALLDHQNKIVVMGKNAREKAEQNFHPEAHYEWIAGVYDRIMKAPKNPPC